MALKSKDFIAIEFTAKLKDGDIFDSNVKKDLAKAGIQGNLKPFVFALGEGMFLKGVEEFLIGKEVGEYTIELSPEKAFGKRDPKLIQMIPLKEFRSQQVNPIPGQVFNFDGKLAKILTVSGGRVMVDFNNPIAGKDVVYEIKILEEIKDLNKKVEAMIDFFFRQDFKFNIEGKELNLEVIKGFGRFAELFKEKFKKLLDLNLKVSEIEEKEEVKTEERSKEKPKSE